MSGSLRARWLFALAVPLAVAVHEAPAQVSPGPLARAHAGLEGTMSCVRCHGASRDAMEERCLSCHGEIAWLKERNRGLHARAAGACSKCHPDHAGVDFDLVAWDEGSPAAFDHARTGWPLAGRHAGLACAKCHQERFQVSGAIAAAGRPWKGTWVGLETDCASCHDDVHRGALGTDCAACHDDRAFKPASKFDHARSRYPLLGRHATVPCAACHAAPRLSPAKDDKGAAIPVYRGLAFAECSACHRDVHEARLGPACAGCHTVDGFRVVAAGSFDHARTRWPLRGAHAKVACAACHGTGEAARPRPPHGACAACHADPHAATATLGGKPADCAACHSEAAWSPSTFTAARHASTNYPLEGKHAGVRCAACHVKAPPGAESAALGKARVRIRPAHGRCADCHADAHAGQLRERADGGRCESCHGVAGWKPSLFAAADHGRLRLPLDGRHAAIACAACHGPDRKGLAWPPEGVSLGTARVALRLPEIGCADCHADPHLGWPAAPAAMRAEAKCADCHDARAFAPVTFEPARHDRFSFRLEGAHRTAPCVACHEEMREPRRPSTLRNAAAGGRRLDFAKGRSRCEECHKDPHAGRFAGKRGEGRCEACHDVERFSPAARFDHDRETSFRLEGVHSKVACARCHPASTAADGRAFVLYKGTPARCEACHGKRPSGPATRLDAATASGTQGRES